MLHKFNQSVFYRIIFIFIGMMIPLYLLGTLLYLSSTSRLRTEILTNISSQMDFYLVSLENEVDRILKMQIELMNYDDLIYLANAQSVMSNFEKTMAKQRVERRILLFKYSSDYVRRVDVDILEMGITISSEEGLNSLSPLFATSLEQMRQNGAPIMQVKDDGWVLHSAFPQRIMPENEPVFIVRTEILRDRIDDHLSQPISTFGGTFAYSPEGVQYGQSNPAVNTAIIDAFSANPASSMVVDIPEQGKYLAIKKHSNNLDLDYYGYASENEVFAPANRIAVLFVVFSAAMLVAVMIFAAFSSRTVHQPVTKLVHAFEHLDQGDLEVRIQTHREDEFSYLYEAFNTTVENLKNLFTQVSNYEVLNREARIKQLQAQISPHFLFNCLYIIHRMARMGDLENVARFTDHLRDYYRYITRDAKNEVFLAEEIEHARNYTTIQQVRFSNRIRILWDDLPEGFEDLIVPRLILQPLIENAFQYGLRDVEENGLLKIRIRQNGSLLQIDVENNGPVPTKAEMDNLKSLIFDEDYRGETTALRNIHRRISALYGDGCGINPMIIEENHFCIRITMGKRA